MQIFLDGVGNEAMGIVLSKKPDIPTAQRIVTTTTVPGSTHGSLTQKQGWDDVAVKCEFTIMPTLVPGLTGQQGFNNILRRLNSWVMNSRRLKFSDDKNFYRLVKQVSVDTASPGEIELVGTVSVTFTLDPFWYKESELVTVDKESDVYNPGTVNSEPLITVYGSGVVKFSVNGVELTLLDVVDYFTVDSWQKVVVHAGEEKDYDQKLSGKYPVLPPGDNRISLGNNATKIVMDGRWAWL